MLGQGSKFAKMCREENYIGADFEIFMDLTDFLYDNWRDFNEKFIPVWMQNVPGKSKTSAGLACGFLWTIVKGLKIGDVVLSPSGEGFYYGNLEPSECSELGKEIKEKLDELKASGVSEEVIHETIYKQIMQINRRLPSFKQMKALELRSTEFEKTTSKKIKRHLVK